MQGFAGVGSTPAVFERIVDALGTMAFGDAILAAANELMAITEIFAFHTQSDLRPTTIASSGLRGSSIKRAALYTEQFYQLDPMVALLGKVCEGYPIGRAVISAADISDRRYRSECFERPGFGQKVCFAQSRGAHQFVLSFYCAFKSSGAQNDRLGALAELVFPLLRKQSDLLSDDANLSVKDRIEARLCRSYPSLTCREREVCARTMIGMTAEAAALDLGISVTSVLTYRRRAYRRDSISGVGQLVERLLN